MPRHETCSLAAWTVVLCLVAPAAATAESPPEEIARQAMTAVHGAMDADAEDRVQAVEEVIDRWAPELRALGDEPAARDALLHVRLDLGRVYVLAGRTEAARRTFRRVAREGEGSSWAESAEGWLYELDHLNVGQPAPDFEVETLSGETLSAEELEGRVTVLSFWGTY
ncbi:MAG: hypothetical protein ACLF0P_06535 [Thermoanaerobaculia bacterium]